MMVWVQGHPLPAGPDRPAVGCPSSPASPFPLFLSWMVRALGDSRSYNQLPCTMTARVGSPVQQHHITQELVTNGKSKSRKLWVWALI